ncbi:MAG: RNA methyltransferase, partial [Acetatifactor sp.]|nr:RNA methyltransferase [Acetatifactor sp.]
MLPEAFLERMKGMLGPEYDQFIESLSGDRHQALRLNALKRNGEGETAAEYFREKSPFHLTDVSWAKNGYYYEKDDIPGKHPLHEAGAYYIQEPSAMAPVSLLNPQPGEQILDLCAAPGGKSTQIAALMDGNGLLISNEIHPARAKILSENVERMGIRNACVT